jgi:alpha-tubulin suppressor-like RCC1 family protein
MLGDGTSVDSTTPMQVVNLTGALGVSASAYNACSITPSGNVRCWGDNFGGQLGTTTLASSDTPVEVPNVGHAVQVTVGRAFVCALLSDRTATCWGANDHGQLGNGQLGGSPYFMAPASPVAGLAGAASISAGYGHACALMADGTVRCWGDNQSSQLGTAQASAASPVPVAVDGLTGVVAVSAGSTNTCALLADQSVWCWGDNIHGGLGGGTALANVASSATPVKVEGITAATAISVHETACALLIDHTVACWGRNETGTLGNGSLTDSSVPVPVTGLANVTGIVTGDTHTCAALADGTYACWGNDQYGQLGDGTTTSSPSPVAVTVL